MSSVKILKTHYFVQKEVSDNFQVVSTILNQNASHISQQIGQILYFSTQKHPI